MGQSGNTDQLLNKRHRYAKDTTSEECAKSSERVAE